MTLLIMRRRVLAEVVRIVGRFGEREVFNIAGGAAAFNGAQQILGSLCLLRALCGREELTCLRVGRAGASP